LGHREAGEEGARGVLAPSQPPKISPTHGIFFLDISIIHPHSFNWGIGLVQTKLFQE
jgi:hypothetical protein